MLGVAHRWVAKERSSTNDFSNREESQCLDSVDGSLGSGGLVGLNGRELVEQSFLFAWGLQHLEPRLVNLLELGLSWWSQTFALVDSLGDLSTDLTPVDSTVGELGGLGDGGVHETSGLVDDGRHYW